MPKKKANPNHLNPLVDVFKHMQSSATTNPFLGPQLEQFWDTQEKMLKETEVLAQHWFERRHEAVRTALEAARSASTVDPSKVMETMAQWQKLSADRLVADAQEWIETVTRCAAYEPEPQVAAVEKVGDDAASATIKAGESLKSEPD